MKKLQLIIIPILFLLGSCKKESNLIEIKADNKTMSLVKNWYAQHHKIPKHLNVAGKDSTTEIPIGSPEWDSSHSYSQSQITKFIIPMRLDKESKYTNQFIIVYINGDEVIKSEYAYLLLDSTATNNYSKEGLETLSPEVFDLINIPSDLKAWLIKYDFDNNVVAMKHISDGTAEEKDLNYNVNINSRAPMEGCTETIQIDWYLQHYENGILIWEEYQFSTTECVGGGGGGGGGTGGSGTGSNASCNMTSEEANDLLDDIQFDELLQTYVSPIGPAFSEDGSSIQFQHVNLKWPFLVVTYPGSQTLTLNSNYSGLRYRGTSSPWKFQTLNKINITSQDNTPLCVYASWDASNGIPGITQFGIGTGYVTYTISTWALCVDGIVPTRTRTRTILNDEMNPF